MLVKVLDVDRLVMHYLWMLEDLKEARGRVEDWGFDVKEEKKLGVEARKVLCQMRASGRVVI